MFSRRFNPYIIGGGIVALLSVFYFSYRTYQTHVEFQSFMSNTQALNSSLEGQHDHSSYGHVHHGEGLSVASNSDQIGEAGVGSGHEHRQAPDGEYVYEINGHPLFSNVPLTQASIGVHEWIRTGKMTPAAEKQFRIREELKNYVIQTVVDPDGNLYTVTVPRDSQYEEGDAILQSELGPPLIDLEAAQMETAQRRKSFREGTIIRDGVKYYAPEEYYSIRDRYERREYLKKFSWSIEKEISMAEVERKVAQGELDFSLSKAEKSATDELEAIRERSRMFSAPASISLSDKPPVKVSFLPDEGPGALPGWARKGLSNFPLGSNEVVSDEAYSGTDTVSERESNEDASGSPVRSDVPLSPLDLLDMVEPTFSPQSEAGVEASNTTSTPPTTESIATQLRERLSPEHFGKAQQLIDQYGTEEGLRRLREMAPEAARQFEQERRPVPSRDVLDGEQSESGSKD